MAETLTIKQILFSYQQQYQQNAYIHTHTVNAMEIEFLKQSLNISVWNHVSFYILQPTN